LSFTTFLFIELISIFSVLICLHFLRVFKRFGNAVLGVARSTDIDAWKKLEKS